MQREMKSFEHIIGSAVMDANYHFKVVDEKIYRFLGDKVIYLFTPYIHPDDREIFINAVKDCDRVSENYAIVRVKNFAGQYCHIIIFIKPSPVDPDNFYELNMYDVVYLVKEYEVLSDAYKKVSYGMQLLHPAITFDYTPATGKIMVFCDRDKIGFEGSIDDFYSFMVEKDMVDPMHISGFCNLIEDIKKCSANISCTLNMCPFTESKRKSPMSVRTTIIYDRESAAASCVVGVIVPEEGTYSALEKMYDNRSNLDPLTGLYNKAAIREMATDAINNTNEIINYIMIDLDHFKDVNDTYGHMFGDEVILNVARIIKDIVGKNGYVGRVGGDEFFIVLKGIGSELDDLRPTLRAIRAQIEWAYKGKLGNIKLTASLGCASFPKDADNYDDLFKLADRCLYIAKTKGRDRFVIYTEAIHGKLEDIKASGSTIKIDRTVSDLQRLEFVTDAVTRLSDWGESTINSVFNEIFNYFRVDQVVMYDLAQRKAIHYGAPLDEDDAEDNICLYADSLKAAFRESNVMFNGDRENIRIPYPDFYEYTVRKNYLSVLIYAIKVKGEITHFVVAYTKNRYERWSDIGMNYLSIIFKTAGDKVLNKN